MKLDFLLECVSTAGIAIMPTGLPVKRKKKKKYFQEEKEEDKKGLSNRKQVNTMKKVWQPLDTKRHKSNSWYNKKGVYAATTSMDHPYGEMGI